MLKKLKVQNFALIDYADIEFQNTLIVITGETGAGKSILLNALSLALGGKSDASVLFDKNKKNIIEATFDISDLDLKHFFQANDLDENNEVFLRREIAADGKSRAFINDTPVHISLLKTLGEQLIDIHSQHQNLLIHSLQFRYNFVDAIAENIKTRMDFALLYKQYLSEKKELNELIHRRNTEQKEMDYHQYLLKELQEANIQANELAALEADLSQLENAENIIQQLTLLTQFLENSDINVIQLLTEAKSSLQSISKYHSRYEELLQRIQSSIIELKDIANEAEKYMEGTEYNPERIKKLTDRINIIHQLSKKHQVKTDIELLQIQSVLESKIADYQNIDGMVEEKTKKAHQLEKEVLEKAEALSKKRKSVRGKIEKECLQILKELSMPNAQFIVEITSKNNANSIGIDEFGKDEIKFLFSANKGIEPSEVQKTASGGEIARLMLAIKSLMVKKIQLPAIVFDEIDTGVSGAVAAKMGAIMKKMSEHMQVIAITHLPQIAAKGQQHFYVSKQEIQNKTISKIEVLHEKERILEIAKMLSSGIPGDAAIQNAKELLK